MKLKSEIRANTSSESVSPTLVSSGRRAERWQPILHSFSRGGPRWLAGVFLSAITLGSGLLNLLSVMGGPSHRRVLAQIFPIEFFQLSRTLTLLVGFALIVSSLNIYKRKKRAWGIVLGLAALSTVFHLVREVEYREALFSFALVVLLLLMRNMFTVKSSVPNISSAFWRLLLAATIAVGYGVAGFWFLDERHFGINFHIGDSIRTTLHLLSLSGDSRLVPHTEYAKWFLDSLYLTTVTAILYSGFALFRPVIHRFREVPRERALARDILQRYGRISLDFFKVWPDKSYFFSSSHRCFLAYKVGAHVALVLGDPVGPEDEIEPTIREFLEMCRDNGWGVGFYQVLPDFLAVYRRVGLHKLKIGDDAVVQLSTFSLEGRSKRGFRKKISQLEAMGIRAVEYAPPIPDHVLAQLKAVSDEWLQIPGRRERTFTLGQFDPGYLRSTPLFAALDRNGNMLAFINLISTSSHREISGDLIRRRTEAPNGTMDYLLANLFLRLKGKGYERFNLGMVPMAGFHEREEATAEERAIHSFFQQLNFLFSFRGLRYYKAKFDPVWAPRYLIYRHILELPRLAFALRRVSEFKASDRHLYREERAA
jgi:phosphatidylglycerol lysyltransferase